MPDPHAEEDDRGARRRLRAGLRRHGVVPRPSALRRLLPATDLRFTSGNALDLYPDGRAGLAAMLEAIEAGRRRVHLETYILRTDGTGRRFLAALESRARAGAEVRVLYDAIGSLGIDPGALAGLRAAGGDVVAFNPLTRLYPRWAPRRRDHRKLLVVDGELAFTGGLNIGDEYRDGVGFRGRPDAGGHWRDAHVRVRGPAVAQLEAVFLESWFRADGPDRPWMDLAESGGEAPGESAVGVLADGPTYRRRRTRDLLVRALTDARRRVRLATPYFVPGRRLLAALEEAAGRGVRVDLLLAGVSDHPFLRWAARGAFPQLLDRGVRIFEYRRAMMHAKAAVFDESWAVVGTSNLDRQSLQHSYEVNLVVAGGAFPEHLAAQLDADAMQAHPVTRAVLARRSVPERARDRLAAFALRYL